MATPAVELEIGDRTVRVSNPDKPYFAEAGVSKMDVVEYYLSVGEGILRALQNRPTTLERWPGGVAEGMKLATRVVLCASFAMPSSLRRLPCGHGDARGRAGDR